MNYRLPEPDDREMIQDYIREHFENGEHSLSAGLGVESMAYSDWVMQMQKNASEPNGDWGRSLTLLCLVGEHLIGLLNIRYELKEELHIRYGDIGYGVRPSERGKGYATEMMRHGIEICREKGMKEVAAGCFSSNVASERVLQKNGGKLTREVDGGQEGRTRRYYTFTL